NNVMLKGISWSSFALTILIVTIGYYLIIGMLFYKKPKPSPPPIQNPDPAQQVMMRLTTLFEGKQNKSELLFALQRCLKPFHDWDEPGFRESINAFIVSVSQNNCGIALSPEELRTVWL